MMKLIFTFLFVMMAFVASAQWTTSGTNTLHANTGNVGIDIDPPLEKLHINGSIRGGTATSGALRINTSTGYTDIGSQNSSWSHFRTDRPRFYFDKPITVNGGLGSYDLNDLFFQTHATTRMTIVNSTGDVGINTTAPQGKFQVNTERPVIIKSNGTNGIYGSEIGFNAVLNTTIVPNQFKKLGNSNQHGGASIAVDYTGNMLFQLYNAATLNESIIDYSPQIAFKNNGNVGIGNLNPVSTLSLKKGSNTNPTDVPSIRLGYGGQAENYEGMIGSIDFAKHYDNYVSSRIYSRASWSLDSWSGSELRFATATGAGAATLADRMTITSQGNVGIGTTSPNQKLTVNGTVYSREVKVDLTVPGPDYVFEPMYNLPTLAETEAYIKANKHLPEVPSAKEMEANGINLSEMNMLLLKKVEELTLHIIKQEKRIAELETLVKPSKE